MGHARSQEAGDRPHRNPHASNARLTTHEVGIQRDAMDVWEMHGEAVSQDAISVEATPRLRANCNRTAFGECGLGHPYRRVNRGVDGGTPSLPKGVGLSEPPSLRRDENPKAGRGVGGAVHALGSRAVVRRLGAVDVAESLGVAVDVGEPTALHLETGSGNDFRFWMHHSFRPKLGKGGQAPLDRPVRKD